MKAQAHTTAFSKNVKIVIIILSVLLAVSSLALAGRIIYLRFFADGTTAIVPDNLIGGAESSAPSVGSGGAADVLYAPKRLPILFDSEATETTDTSNTEVKAATVSLYMGKPTDNQRFTVENMLPGDHLTKYYQLKVDHNDEVEVYFNAVVTEELRDLGDALRMKITYLNGNKVLYDGTFSAMEADKYVTILPKAEENESIVYYKIEVYLPGETGNEYQLARLKSDFKWYVKDVKPLDPPTTGESIDTVLFAVMTVSAFSLLIVLLVSRRRRKEAQDAEG